ncbi:unnamed protein product, partial [Mesorhabditis spiculigera]
MLFRICCFVALLQLVAADCDATTQAAIVQCYTPFLHYYGLTPVNGTLPPYNFVETAMSNKFDQQGRQAAQDMCAHSRVLNSCLNATMYPIDYNCYNHIVVGKNNSESYLYQAEIATRDYECGAGAQIFFDEFYCIRATQANQADKIQQCRTDLEHDLHGMQLCDAFNKFISCNSLIYAKACDYNAGVLICNIFKYTGDTYYEYCQGKGQRAACPNYRVNPKFLMHKNLM